MKKISLVLLSAVVLSSIASSQKLKSSKQPPPSPGKSAEDTAAHAAGAPINAKTYIIGAEDVLFIKVWNEAQLTSAYIVRPDGKISMPLAGEIVAAGLTPEKLGSDITEALAKTINHPDVSVAVQAVNSKKYFIMGEVQRTGSFPLLVPTTVMEALVNAGGFKDFAKKSSIVIIRGSQRFKFNYNNVYKGKSREENILLEPGDQIVVP